LFCVELVVYSQWVKIALYSRFRCHCECILFYSEMWVKFYSLFCVEPVVYSQRVKVALYSRFRCHCECILFYSEIWVIFTQSLCVTVNAFFYSNIWVDFTQGFFAVLTVLFVFENWKFASRCRIASGLHVLALTVYKLLVRSVLEYCAPVWHTSIPCSVPLWRSRKGSETSFPNSISGKSLRWSFGAIRMLSVEWTSFFVMQKDF
jgi:hypothetical protein